MRYFSSTTDSICSTIKRGSATNSKRTSNRSINPSTLYDYVLRCAILAWIEQTRSESKKRTSFYTNLFENVKVKDKLPRDVTRALYKRLEGIHQERDISIPEYSCPTFRTVCKTVAKDLAENRYKSLDDVTDLFLQANSSVQSSAFTNLMLEILQEEVPSIVTQDLLDKLQSCEKPQRKRSSTLLGSCSLEEFPIIVHLKELFNVQDQEHREMLYDLAAICTETALFHDLKSCINSIHTNHSFLGKREDFYTDEAYEQWQRKEIKQLTEKMNTIIYLNPKLSIVPSNEDIEIKKTGLSRRSRTDSVSSTSSNSEFGYFVFIPSDPKNYFRYLMNICIDHNSNLKLRPSHLLSLESEELLRECWKTWRLSWPFRVTLHLNSIKSSLSDSKVHIDETKETMKLLEKVLKDHPIGTWTEADSSFLKRVLIGLNNTLLHVLANQLFEYWEIRSHAWIEDVLEMLDRVLAISAHSEVYFEKTKDLLQLEESIKSAAIKRWKYIEHLTSNKESDDLTNLSNMAEVLNKEISTLIDRDIHKLKVMDTLSVPSVVMDVLLPYFALEMENWSISPESRTCSLDLVFELYNKVNNLERLYQEYGSRNTKSSFEIESWFLPHIKRWLHRVNESTFAWVKSAVEEDDFSRTNHTTLYSTSVIDFFSILDKSVQFFIDLHWPNHFQYCVFHTRLSKVVSESVEIYCKAIEALIKEELECDSNPDMEELEVLGGSIFDLAKYQLLGMKGLPKETRSIPKSISPKVCVKLNDIEALRCKLNKLYQSMEGDKLAEYIRANIDDQRQDLQARSYSYSIELLCSHTLQPLNRSGMSNPYVVFEINGKKNFKSRTVYQSLNPKWNQEHSIKTTEKSLDILAIVYNEDIMGPDEECGSVWFKLSHELFGDYQAHRVQLPLSPQGTLTLRICMEGEKNDIQFWYGKTFRTLKRTENDVADHIVSKMTPYINSFLSRQSINKLLCRTTTIFSSLSLAANKNTKIPTIHECENSLSSLIDFLEDNLSVLYDNLFESVMHLVILKIWKEILMALDGILLPPLSEQVSDMTPLDIYELDVVFKWIELLKILFNGGEDGDAIPLDELECSEYYSLLSLNTIYHSSTKNLIQLCQTAQKSSLAVTVKTDNEDHRIKKTSRSRSIYYSKSTVRSNYQRPKAKDQVVLGILPTEYVLRLLRMRHEKSSVDYLHSEYKNRNNTSLHQRNKIVLL